MDIILEKVSEIFQELKKQATRSSHEHLEIKATTGWFVKFKKRTGIKHLVMPGEFASADKESDKFCLVFKKILETEVYSPQQIFNSHETGLFWKLVTNVPTLRRMKKNNPGLKPMKDCSH